MSLNSSLRSCGSGVAAMLLVAQLGCATHRPTNAAVPDAVQVVFSNESSDQAEVWVIAPDVDTRRVGTVMAGETTTLAVPREFFGRGTISFYTHMRTSSGGPGIYDVRIRENEPLRIRLPRDARRLELVR